MNMAAPPLGPTGFLHVLAHDLRWQLLTALGRSDRQVQELVTLVGQPQNLVSYHLRRLRTSQLVTERRSSADARDVYYSLDLGKLQAMYSEAGTAIHPALSLAADTEPRATSSATGPPVRVLFLCTENSARSQMAEALLRSMGGEGLEVASAGSQPSAVHPDAIRCMAEMGLDISQARPKHLDEYRHQRFDYVITVCDRVREVCPVFPDDPERIHWSFPDPCLAAGDEDRRRMFHQTAHQLITRLRFLLTLIERERGGRR